MSFASMQSMTNQRAINQKPRRRKPQPQAEWSTGTNPAPRAAMGGARAPIGLGASLDSSTGLPRFGTSLDSSMGLPKIGTPKEGGARREVAHGRRASGSGTPSNSGGRRGVVGGGVRGASEGGRGPVGGGAAARAGPHEPAPRMAKPSLLDQAPILTEEQILSLTDDEVEEMLAKVRKQAAC